MENTIAVVTDAAFLGHEAPLGHPERPERLAAAEAALAEAKLSAKVVRLPPRDATDDELGRVHTARHLETVAKTTGRSGHLDGDTYYTPKSHAAARRAAGGAVALVDALMAGEARYGVAVVRPPGHHARPDSAMGFCLFNNVAVAVAHARARGAARVAVVDWDVHHGNGTQETFYADPSVLFISLHQFPFYPGTGAATETGAGEGRGATVNVPLSAGAGDSVYVAAFDRIVAPALAEFAPDLVLVSAGFDAHERDPLAAMNVTADGYARMARRVARAWPGRAAVPIGVVLEGGYDLTGLRSSLRATLEALDDPSTEAPAPSPDPGAHAADLDRASDAARRHFKLS